MAYRLFARHGIQAVGIAEIIARSGTAKVTLYRHFRSKEDLVVAVLDLHEELWSVGWLQGQVLRRTDEPRERLLIIFRLLDEWFKGPDFLGCLLTRALLETPPEGRARKRAEEAVSRIENFLVELAEAADLDQPQVFAALWHILMKGSILSAHAKNADAALQALEGAKRILDSWPTTDAASSR
jgi:AcrR family transcriptional regulator